jgi:hypothetical protein
MRAANVNGIDVRLFEFTSEFYMPMGRGRFDGLMACDGTSYRIAIYWMEPAVYHDNTFFLGYSDFIFIEGKVHYWINGVSKPGSFDLSGNEGDPLLPRDVSVESVGRSVLAIASRIRSEAHSENLSLELCKFFQQSRNKSEYLYEVPSEQRDNDPKSGSNVSDDQILNNLPFGRKYSKQMKSDGTMIWRAQRIWDGPHIAKVTVKPVSGMETDDTVSLFDTETLGQWTLIPESYRAYWSFEREYPKLKNVLDNDIASRKLYEKIEYFMENNNVPARLYPFLDRLLLKTALLTGDTYRISLSAQVFAKRLCEDDLNSDYQCLLELARIAEEISKRYPQQAEELLRPLVEQMVKRSGQNITRCLGRLMKTIENNKWFWYGKLVVEELRIQSLLEVDVTNALSARLETARLSREVLPYDRLESSPSVKQYLTQIDSYPPKGKVTMDDIRQILEKGLEKSYADANLKLKHNLIDDVISMIRMLDGEGPFRGDKAKLTESIEQFSRRYLVVFKHKEPIDTVLATFLALSFCDISTKEDHDLLFSQISEISAEFQALTYSMLSKRGLNKLIKHDDVEQIFDRYKKIFRNYIDDPLWPAFKFPLTINEQTRLRNTLKLRIMQLDPLFEEISLMVKHGDTHYMLKSKTRYEIASAILQLLPQTAFLRKPAYPGVSCQHKGGYGFAAVIRGPLYVEGKRPREKFKAMKYFHMGHRLEDVVMRERELAGFK